MKHEQYVLHEKYTFPINHRMNTILRSSTDYLFLNIYNNNN